MWKSNRMRSCCPDHPAGPDRHRRRARVGPGTTLVSCEVGADSEVIQGRTRGRDNAHVGPFAYRDRGQPRSSAAGAYVEIKNLRR